MTDYKKLVEALRCCIPNPLETCEGCEYDTGVRCNVTGMMADAADAIKKLVTLYEKAEMDATNLTGKLAQAEAEVERLKDSNEELREKQTYIDHYGDKWMTSAKDVPTAAYKHGYADGMAEERAKMQKRIEELEAKNKELHGRIEDKELQIDMLTADNTNYEIAIDELKAEVKKAAKRNAELHAELQKWVSAAEQAGEPNRGEWVRVEDEESYHYECSECGERPLYSRYGDVVLSGVCPMCGAKTEVQK